MRKGLALLFCATALAGGTAAARPDPGADAFRTSQAELLAKVAKTSDGLAAATLPTGADATVLQLRRDRTGEVEVHKAKDDLIVAQSGRATILVGSSASGGRETAPGEWRGGAIGAGGRSFMMAPGDVLWIPAGLPHQVIVSKGEFFSYLAVKFDAAAKH